MQTENPYEAPQSEFYPHKEGSILFDYLLIFAPIIGFGLFMLLLRFA